MLRLYSLLYALSVVFALALAQGTGDGGYDPVKDFCRRWGHQTAVVGNRLFVDGGQENHAGMGPKNYTNKLLLFHDLSTTNGGGMPPLINNLTKGDEVPSVINGALFADNANAFLYLYGGEAPEGTTPDPFNLWRYDVYNNNWTSLVPDSTISPASFGAATTVERLGKGYYLGGYIGEQNSPDWLGPRIALNKLLEYDFVNNEWANDTQPDEVGRAEGVMVYIPAGDNGMLLHFGGLRFVNGNASQPTPASMAQIDIYDIAASKWYQQNATGKIPEMRRRFVGGVASAQDLSSFNIYIYGGLGFGKNASGFDDIWILTVPAFVWTQVYPPASLATHFPHYDLSVNVVNTAQMIIIGGQFPLDPNVNNCDAATVAGAHNLNMGKDDPDKAYWALYQPNLTTYDVPIDIQNIIGGVPTGAATLAAPKNGFSDPNLKVLFSRTVTASARAATRTPPPGFGGPQTPSATKKSTPLGLIVGPSVAGGVIILFLVCLGIFCFCRRKKPNRPLPSQAPELTPIQIPRAPRAAAARNSDNGNYFNENHSYAGSTLHSSPPNSPSNSPITQYQNHQMPNLASTHYFAYNPVYGPSPQQRHMQYGEQYGDYGNSNYPQPGVPGVIPPIELPPAHTPAPMEKSEWDQLHPEVLPPSPGSDPRYQSEMIERTAGEKFRRTS